MTCVGGAGGCEEDGMQGGWAPGVRCDEAAVPGRVSCLAVLSLAVVLGRPGDDLLSQVLRHSTIGAEEFNGRVRDGIGFRLLARATRPAKDKDERRRDCRGQLRSRWPAGLSRQHKPQVCRVCRRPRGAFFGAPGRDLPGGGSPLDCLAGTNAGAFAIERRCVRPGEHWQ